MLAGMFASRSAAPPVFVPTMLDPLNKGSNVVLSNLNLTARKATGGSGFEMARSVKGETSGKFYFEITWDEFTGSFIGVGLGDQDASVGNFFGSDGNGILLVQNGEVYANGALRTTIQTSAESNISGVAFDVDDGWVWFRTSGGNWNNNPAADPATGVGGLAFPGTHAAPGGMSGTIYAGVMVQDDPNDQMSINFGPTFAGTPPAGFEMIGELGPPSILGLAGITDTL